MAGLPHLLIGIFIVGSTLIGAVKGINLIVFGYLQASVFCLLILGVLLYSINKGWRHWSASWIVYMFIFAISLLDLGVIPLLSSITIGNKWVYGLQMILIPLLLAYLLYKTVCKDRLRGLLATVPPMAIIWVYFQEFVPAIPRSLAWSWMFILAFSATVFMLRTKRFTPAIGLAMLVPILGGFLFTYLGVYMDGTLSFSTLGPSLQEVFRQYIPFLLMVLTIVLGPQLAVKLRGLGRENAKVGGKIFYRLALGGLLLGLVLTLLQFANLKSGFIILPTVKQAILIAALMLYLAGFMLLVWAVRHSESPSGDISMVLRLLVLFILLPCVPIIMLLVIPNFIMGSSTESWLYLAAEIAWVFAAIWVVKD